MIEYADLISGLGQKIFSTGDLGSDAGQMNTPESSMKLTDGVRAVKSTYTDPAYFKFYGSIDRTVVFDLGKMCTVSGFFGSFLKEDQTAVHLPHYIRVTVSEDGDGWCTAGELRGLKDPRAEAIIEVNIEFEKKYLARYVAVTFPVACWVFCDAMKVFGCEGETPDSCAIVPEPKVHTKYPNRYVMPEMFHNVHDVMLAYNCLYSDPQRGKLRKEQLLPYVGYYDKTGKMRDFFFDSYLFLPFVSATPSGGRYYDDPHHPGTLSDWDYYIDDTFEQDRNIYALEQAVGEAKETLGDTEYKANVFFSILYPTATQKEFGVVDGKMLDFSSLEDRKTAVRYVIDEQLRRYKASDFKNLRLLGFYWFHEAVNYADPDEIDLLRYTTDYVRSIGFSTIWIPWYQASGFNEWDKFGFDVACMQPNYAFTKNTARVVYANAETTRRLGMCVEMEIGGRSYEALARFRVYMKAGAQCGYMNALHMYYQNGGPGEFYHCMLSDDPKVNAVYHEVYLFVKHRLPVNGIKLDKEEFECVKGGVLDGKLGVCGRNIVASLYSTTKDGALTLANDGTFKYIPSPDFSGADRFFVDVTEDGKIKDIYEIVIKVV